MLLLWVGLFVVVVVVLVLPSAVVGVVSLLVSSASLASAAFVWIITAEFTAHEGPPKTCVCV